MENKHLTHLFIRNHKLIGIALTVRHLDLSDFGEIACSKEHTPQIVNRIVNLIIGQIKPKLLLHKSTCHELLNLISRGLISLVHKALHHIIATAVNPERTRSG